jgi:IS30 family transposase
MVADDATERWGLMPPASGPIAPKVATLTHCKRLLAKVEAKLAENWSPEEISGWLARTYPNDPEMYVSHETFYQSIFFRAEALCATNCTSVCVAAGRCGAT